MQRWSDAEPLGPFASGSSTPGGHTPEFWHRQVEQQRNVLIADPPIVKNAPLPPVPVISRTLSGLGKARRPPPLLLHMCFSDVHVVHGCAAQERFKPRHNPVFEAPRPLRGSLSGPSLSTAGSTLAPPLSPVHTDYSAFPALTMSGSEARWSPKQGETRSHPRSIDLSGPSMMSLSQGTLHRLSCEESAYIPHVQVRG